MNTEKQLTAVEWIEQEILKGELSLLEIIEQAKEMEDSQATEYAKWSMEINQLTGHFFTFLEWIKDEPKDETFKSE